MLEQLIEQAKQTPYFHLDGYMERYWLYPFQEGRVNTRIHHILRSDSDRHFHDHPWPSTSVILKGGYWEILPLDQNQPPELDEEFRKYHWRAEGDIITREAKHRHAIELPKGQTAWSMFIMGNMEQQWGFYLPEGKQYWREYLNDYTTSTMTDPADA